MNRKHTLYYLIIYFIIICFSYAQAPPPIKKYLIYDDFSIPKKLYPYLEAKTSKTNRRAHAILHETLYEGKKNKIIKKGAIKKENDYSIFIDLPSNIEVHWTFSDGSIITAGRKEEVEPFNFTEYATNLTQFWADISQAWLMIVIATRQ